MLSKITITGKLVMENANQRIQRSQMLDRSQSSQNQPLSCPKSDSRADKLAKGQERCQLVRLLVSRWNERSTSTLNCHNKSKRRNNQLDQWRTTQRSQGLHLQDSPNQDHQWSRASSSHKTNNLGKSSIELPLICFQSSTSATLRWPMLK